MNGETYHTEMPPDSVFAIHRAGSQPYTDIFAGKVPSETNNEAFSIRIYGDSTTGTFPAAIGIFISSGVYFNNNQMWTTPPTDTITIVEFGTVNNYVAGSFTAKVINDAIKTDTSTFTCSFRVKRLE
jgi:hypothetical protein